MCALYTLWDSYEYLRGISKAAIAGMRETAISVFGRNLRWSFACAGERQQLGPSRSPWRGTFLRTACLFY